MKKGLFITFEGLDASGKSTQIAELEKWLAEKGLDPIVTREPGGTALGEKIRELLLDKENSDMDPVTEAYLYAASRAQHVREKILPALEEGRIVISDRYLDSSIAYQGWGRDLGEEAAAINISAIAGVMPDLTLLLMTDPEDFRKRRSGGSEDRIEAEQSSFHERVRMGFEHQAGSEPERIVRIDGKRSIEEIAEEIRMAVGRLIGDRR